MRVGLVGAGFMGSRIGRQLVEKGYAVAVNDLRRESAAGLLGLGASWAETPRTLAQSSDVVITSLPGPAEVEQVLFDAERGALKGLGAGKAYIDMTTNTPSAFRKIAQACRALGVGVLDAPVSGPPPEMTIMVGGDATTYEKYRNLLEAMGRNVFYLGTSGSGMVAKAINQFLTFGNFLVQAEGLLLGAKAGLDVRVLAQAIGVSSGRSLQLDAFPRVVFAGAFEESGGRPGPLNRWVKDISCAAEVARETHYSPKVLGIIEEVLKEAQAEGWGHQAWHGAVRVFERLAGIELRPTKS